MLDVPESLTALWELADDIADRGVSDPLHALEPAGLVLIRPLERWDHAYTPVNSLTFALTGEDGVHFGFLTDDDDDLESAPVVMTIPDAAGSCNLIVAGDFDEFLALGAIAGWFTLGQFDDDLDDALETLATPDLDPWAEREQLLFTIREQLELEPMPLTLKRFEELQLIYGEDIVVE